MHFGIHDPSSTQNIKMRGDPTSHVRLFVASSGPLYMWGGFSYWFKDAARTYAIALPWCRGRYRQRTDTMPFTIGIESVLYKDPFELPHTPWWDMSNDQEVESERRKWGRCDTASLDRLHSQLELLKLYNIWCMPNQMIYRIQVIITIICPNPTKLVLRGCMDVPHLSSILCTLYLGMDDLACYHGGNTLGKGKFRACPTQYSVFRTWQYGEPSDHHACLVEMIKSGL